MTPLLRFSDLKSAGVVSNRVTLGRWIDHEGFPPGIMLGPNTRAWRQEDVDAWLAKRGSERKPPVNRPTKAPIAA